MEASTGVTSASRTTAWNTGIAEAYMEWCAALWPSNRPAQQAARFQPTLTIGTAMQTIGHGCPEDGGDIPAAQPFGHESAVSTPTSEQTGVTQITVANSLWIGAIRSFNSIDAFAVHSSMSKHALESLKSFLTFISSYVSVLRLVLRSTSIQREILVAIRLYDVLIVVVEIPEAINGCYTVKRNTEHNH
jgi:hypothetical protein